jgi:long-subunit fatty acid transport protein
LGFNVLGGGGSATYDNGLPSFEYPISDLPPAMQLQGQDIRGYRLNSKFDGSSVFYGIQANVSYAITDMISVALGGRYIIAKENYSGYLKNIELNNGGVWIPATTFFTNSAAASQAAADALEPAIQGGAGGLALTTQPLIDALTAAGVYFEGMTNAQAQTAFLGLAATSTFYATLLDDQEVDAEKTAGGFTPIISVNFQPIDMLNFAVKYEHKTPIKFTTSVDPNLRGLIGVEDDGVTPKYMFTDGEETNLDLPSYLSVGATVRPFESLLIAGYYGYFMEKGANWDGREEQLESNAWELALGLEYSISDNFLISGGWLMTQNGATPEYNTDLSHGLGSQGFNFGAAWNIIPSLQLNVGGQYVKYIDEENKFDHDFASQGALFVPVTEKLQRYAWVVGVGLNISIGSGGN